MVDRPVGHLPEGAEGLALDDPGPAVADDVADGVHRVSQELRAMDSIASKAATRALPRRAMIGIGQSASSGVLNSSACHFSPIAGANRPTKSVSLASRSVWAL